MYFLLTTLLQRKGKRNTNPQGEVWALHVIFPADWVFVYPRQIFRPVHLNQNRDCEVRFYDSHVK